MQLLQTGEQEPYIGESILRQLRELSITVVRGDDSHGLGSIGVNMEKGITIFEKRGGYTDWKVPAPIAYSPHS